MLIVRKIYLRLLKLHCVLLALHFLCISINVEDFDAEYFVWDDEEECETIIDTKTKGASKSVYLNISESGSFGDLAIIQPEDEFFHDEGPVLSMVTSLIVLRPSPSKHYLCTSTTCLVDIASPPPKVG
jgi:hypothetical protein